MSFKERTERKFRRLAGTQTKIAYRPHEYHRAVVLEALNERGQTMGLVDIKGAGISPDCPKLHETLETFKKVKHNQFRTNELRVKPHSDGLISLGEAIAEMTRQKAVQMLFDLDRFNSNPESRYQTVETYFIISLPIQILKQTGYSIPAALYGRQPHFGRIYFGDGPAEIYVDDFGKIQQDFFGTAVDFGGVSLTHERVTSDPNMSFGSPEKDPQDSNAWTWGHNVADAFTRHHYPDKNAVYRLAKDMLMPIEKEWRNCLPQIKKHIHINLGNAILFNMESTIWEQQLSGLKALSNDKGQLNLDLWEKAFKILALKLKTPNDVEVRLAAKALTYYSGPKAHLLFLVALNHPDSLVQLFARKALLFHKGDNRVELMERLIKSHKRTLPLMKRFTNHRFLTSLCTDDPIFSTILFIFETEEYQNVPSRKLFPRVSKLYQYGLSSKLKRLSPTVNEYGQVS